MTFAVRVINGTLGGAIAIGRGSEEHKVAIFADAAINDFALVGDHLCLLISRKRSTALVDLNSGNVVKRGRLPIAADYICVSPDLSRALAYNSNPGLMAVVDLGSLEVSASYNLLGSRDDGRFDLLSKDKKALEAEDVRWDSIPTSDGVLAEEVKPDDFWLNRASSAPSRFRRMRFTRGARAVFRDDDRVAIPFTFRKNGREWITNRSYDKPITSSSGVMSVGVAIVDLRAALVELHVTRGMNEPGVETSFPVASISPDGAYAILPSFDPVAMPGPSDSGGLGGSIRKVFGRRSAENRAFGLEIWDIKEVPRPLKTLPFRPITAQTLLRTDTQRFGDSELSEARKEIDLVWPGVVSGYSGSHDNWALSSQKRIEDSYFDPLETRKAPSFIPAYGRVHFPPLFVETLHKLVALHPRPFSSLPWNDPADRQVAFLAAVLNGWAIHSSHAACSIVWSGERTFVCLSRDGMVREMSVDGDLYPAFQLAHPETGSWPFSDRGMFPPQLRRVDERLFAVDLYNEWLEFELPVHTRRTEDAPTARIPLRYRIVKDREIHALEVKEVDRLTERIRRGYVKIGAKDAANVIDGLRKLSREVRDHLEEIVVDSRWIPSLFHRGKPVTEKEFSDLLVADGSDAAAEAMEELLAAFVDATEGKHQNIWHPDDGTPTLGPVAFALVRIRQTVPSNVFRFFAQRDMNHDMWTAEAFQGLDLPPERFVAPDLVKLQIRLAIQDICTGNVDADILRLYRLPLTADRLRKDPSLADQMAELIYDQILEQSPDLTWASNVGVRGVAASIAQSLETTSPGEARLATRLSELAAE